MRHPQQNAQALYEVAAEQGGYFTVDQHEVSRLLGEAFPAVARDRWGSLRGMR
jgi:hypothetical protein